MKVFKLEKVIAHMKNGVNVKQNKNGVGDRLSRIETISDGNFNFDKVGFAELSSDQKSKYKISKNDILFSHINSLEHLGKTAIYEANQEIYHGVNLLLIRANDLVLPKYLRYFFIFLRNSGYWISNGKQAINQASVNQADIKNLQIPVPSLQEQEEIVERLDKESALIAKRTNLNFITLINNLFSSHVNDIVKELYENSPKVAVQDEIYTSDYVANGSFKSLKDNVNTTNKPSFALLVKFNDLSKSKNLKKTYIDESSYNFLKKSNLYEGDLIINNVGANLGKVFIVPNLYKKMSIGPNCIIMRPSNNFLGEYLQIVMNSHYFQTMLREIFGGAAQPKFNKTNFRSLMLPFIDLDKQNEIVSEIKKIEEIKNKLINNQQQIYTKLLELKKSILNKEFSYE